MTAYMPEARTTASALDQHWTPPDMVEILSDHMRERPFVGPLCEPFAGAGRLVAGLASVYHPSVWQAYEIDPQYAATLSVLGVRYKICDAFTVADWLGNVVTNPPFGASLTPVLRRVLATVGRGHSAAILCTHRSLVERRWMPAPSEVLHPRWRPCFGGARAGLAGTCWAIWRPGHTGPTEAYYCERPELAAQGELL